MADVDLEAATTELYALPPAGFTPHRAELAAQARKEGQKALAKEISELRRPTVSAWLVNQLARGAGGSGAEIDELEQLGADLREAQAELDGPKMKALTRRRHELVAALVRRADEVAALDDHKVSAGTRRELEETLGAAVADERASLAVTSGRLTRALVYAGFGEVDVTAATATPVTQRRRHLTSAPTHPEKAAAPAGDDARPSGAPARKADAAQQKAGAADQKTGATDKGAVAAERRAEAAEQSAQAERQQAQDALDFARADEAAAVDDLAAAAERRDEVRAEEARLTGRLDELQQEIVRVRHELDDLTRSIGAADRDHQRRERQVEQARRAVRQAEARLKPS